MAEKNMAETAQDPKDEKEIDLIQMARTLWERKKTILKWCGIGALLGLVIAFSIPREYTTEVKLAPEMGSDSNKNGGMGTLAAIAGLGGTVAGSDAVYPLLYPDILQSIPFDLALLDIPLTNIDGDKKFTLADFLENETESPWWSYIIKAPKQLIGLLSNDEDKPRPDKNAFYLTKKEKELLDMLQDRIQCEIDEKTMVVSISVEMQDPMVSAILADTVANRLQEYVTNYRTNKSRNDLIYVEKLNDEARDAYYKAQQKYAQYLDTHQGIVMYSAQTMRDRLENEATLAFNVYNQTSQKKELAKAKVQEETPVFATIEPASVPLKPSAPRKVLILAGFIFLSFVGACAWILFVEPLKAEWKKG